MFEMELDNVLAKRELVRDVTSEKRREGMVDTPDMLEEACCSAGRERMKICTSKIHLVSKSLPACMKLKTTKERRGDPP